jgi:hypothetical protein
MDFKKIVPHLIAIAALLLVSAFYFSPNAFSGKVLRQGDNDKARGMQTEVREYLAKEGKAPNWTNSAFGGMPAFQIYSPASGNLTMPFYKTLFLWADITSIWVQVFVAMLCMYFLISVLGADWRVGVFGAVAFGISSYNIDILEAGHTTKMAALALAPGVFAGAVLAFNHRIILGGGVTALFVAMQLYANHVQITYYTLLITGLYFLAQLVVAIQHKTFGQWGKALAMVLFAISFGFLCNLSRMWSTYEYSQETIRGRSELSSKSDRGSGLDPEYQFGWSYGIGESLTLLVPHANGGGANEIIRNTEFLDLVTKGASSVEKEQAAQQTSAYYYWGTQPFVGTAIYFGAIVCFLFFLGAFLVPGNVKWWLLSGGIFSLTLAWGGNFFFNYVLNDILPMFNKFRAVSMALGMGQLCFAALAAMGLQKLFDGDISLEKKRKALYYAAGIAVAFCLFAAFRTPGAGPNDDQLAAQLKYEGLSQLLESDRSALARSDAFRSLGLIALAFGLIWFSLRGNIKAGMAVIAITVLSLGDHWMICNRNLSTNKYENKRSATAAPTPQPFDLKIKEDKDLSYRVLDLSRGSIAGNATTSYFHKSLSGYHAAKLQRYQEVVDTFLGADLGKNLHIVGMFNGKYIVSQKGDVIPNDKACGNAWFVKRYEVLPTGDAELHALGNIDPKTKAVIQQSEAAGLQGFTITPDSTATIRLSKYHPDKMEYEYSATTEQLALFSEIYYPPAKGWSCYLNGQKTNDFIKADYLLRAMRLPAGNNMKLEMRFEPQSYYTGGKIATVASILTILLFLGGLFLLFRHFQLPDPNALTDFELEKAVKERPAVAPTKNTKAAPKKK